MLDLETAIKHCKEVVEEQEITAKSNIMEIDKTEDDGVLRLYDADEYESCMKCAAEHRQLAEWLRELQNYQTAREEINQEIINWNDIDNGKVRGLFLAESIIAHYVDGGAE